MFTIIGGDGKEYGPVTVEQMRQWLTGGRANLETRAKKAGEEAWRRLGDFEEFSAAETAPPVITDGATSSGSTPGGRGARTGAAFINAAIYAGCVLPGFLMMSAKIVAQGARTIEQMDPAVMAPSLHVMQLGLFAALAVQACLLAIRSQNIGMLMVGLRVVRITDDQPAGFLHGALLRFLVPISPLFMPGLITFLGLLLLCVDYCFMFRDDRRCLHDLIAGTRVVKV